MNGPEVFLLEQILSAYNVSQKHESSLTCVYVYFFIFGNNSWISIDVCIWLFVYISIPSTFIVTNRITWSSSSIDIFARAMNHSIYLFDIFGHVL